MRERLKQPHLGEKVTENMLVLKLFEILIIFEIRNK